MVIPFARRKACDEFRVRPERVRVSMLPGKDHAY